MRVFSSNQLLSYTNGEKEREREQNPKQVTKSRKCKIIATMFTKPIEFLEIALIDSMQEQYTCTHAHARTPYFNIRTQLQRLDTQFPQSELTSERNGNARTSRIRVALNCLRLPAEDFDLLPLFMGLVIDFVEDSS